MSNIKSIQELIDVYKQHNKSSLDINHLVCSICKNWLTSKIYLAEKHNNICETCQKTVEGISLPNICLENILKGTQFPCKYVSCKTIEENITEHEKSCDKNVKCVECMNELAGKNALLMHLQVNHSMQQMYMQKPKATIYVNHQETKAQFFNLQCGKNVIIVRVISHADADYVNLIFCNASDIQYEGKVCIVYSKADYEYKKFGVILSLGKLWTLPEENYIKFDIKDLNDAKVGLLINVYFEGYEKVEPLLEAFEAISKEVECPICLELMKKYYQCKKGHPICAVCVGKVNTCPVCREALLVVPGVNLIDGARLVNVHSQLYRACVNSKDGCLVYQQGAVLTAHEKECQWNNAKMEKVEDEKRLPFGVIQNYNFQFTPSRLNIIKPIKATKGKLEV